jgi:hypothetical protein
VKLALCAHRDIRTPRPLLALVVVGALAGAAVPLHGVPPAPALGLRPLWHAEVALVLLAVFWAVTRALTLGRHGRFFWLRRTDDGKRPDES